MKELIILIVLEYAAVCGVMHSKDELFGYAVTQRASFVNDYVFGPLAAFLYYILTSSCPFLIAVAPCELGPSLFSGIILSRMVINCFCCFYAAFFLGSVKSWVSHEFITTWYFSSLALTVFGIVTWAANTSTDFELSTFIKPMSGKDYIRSSMADKQCWVFSRNDKDEEIFFWAFMHPRYAPINAFGTWLESLATRFCLESGTEKPAWLLENGEKLRKRMVYLATFHAKRDGDAGLLDHFKEALVNILGEEVTPRQTGRSLVKLLKDGISLTTSRLSSSNHKQKVGQDPNSTLRNLSQTTGTGGGFISIRLNNGGNFSKKYETRLFEVSPYASLSPPLRCPCPCP